MRANPHSFLVGGAEWCAKLGLWISALSIAAMVLITTVGVVLRAFFNYGIAGTDEVAGILMVLSLYMGLAYTFLDDGFIRIEAIRSRLSPKVRDRLDAGLVIVSLAVTAIMMVYFWRTAWISAQRGVQSVGVLTIPLYPWHAAMALGMTFLLLALIARTLSMHFDETKPAHDGGMVASVNDNSRERRQA